MLRFPIFYLLENTVKILNINFRVCRWKQSAGINWVKSVSFNGKFLIFFIVENKIKIDCKNLFNYDRVSEEYLWIVPSILEE